jgi:HEAT repeat protein
MRSSYIATFTSFFVAAAVTASAQQAASGFASANTGEKGRVLVQLIRHQGSTPPEVTAEIIRLGLTDPSTVIREAALSAVVSRAAGPYFDGGPATVTDWIADRDPIQRLRPQVTAALKDVDESVRVAAIQALVSLDFDIATQQAELSNETERLLIAMYHADKSGRVRAKIVGGLATDRTSDPKNVRQLLVGAFDDPDPRVRQAASGGAEKLDRDVALPLLVRHLEDADRGVRGESASVLARYGTTAAIFLPQIEEALGRERDPQVRVLVQAALANIKH